ncbi:MAG TPA: BTAD domain-containing putative transcriptional regulator, partial [Solirubrobacteraceae bacterium]|nr:BTAD domain-containing putative transcriptional regulator [Solirubrobacteraceae bacterium]
MEYRILGPLEVVEDGRVVALGGSRSRALLALLLLHANETLPAERVIDELWGEEAPATASRMLHVQVSRLRKALGNGGRAVGTREHGYTLTIAPGQLDAGRFGDLLERGGRELAAGHAEPAAAVLERALSMWRGAPLADLAYEHFAQAEIARLAELRIHAEEQLIDARLALGRHAEVVGRLPALIGEHPYRERLRGQLMLALYRCDRQADALQAYQDARRALVDDLGIEPGERLRALEQAVLEHDPSLAAPSAPPVVAPVAAPPPAAAERSSDARRAVTVAVADLADAGALAERLDPESLHAVMERFTAECSGVLARHGAVTDDGAGDTVVGVFGLRTRREDDALRAARAGLELREVCAALAAELEGTIGMRPAVGVGLASGEVFAGSGSRPRGEPMHVAAALAAAAPGGAILLSRETWQLAGSGLQAEPAAPVAVRGRSGGVAVWRLDGLAPASPPPQDGPFVARDAELATLRGALAAVRGDDACRRVTIVGPAGIGKSRLVRELAADLGETAALTVGRCHPDGDTTASYPLADLLRGVTGDDAETWIRGHLGDDDRVDVIAERVLGVLGRSPGAAQPGEIAWAARRVFEAAARDRPLVVVVEDAHWAEPALLDLVEYTLAFSGGGAMLLLCVARPELLELRPGWAPPRPESSLVLVEPLDPAAARALLDARAADLEPATAER